MVLTLRWCLPAALLLTALLRCSAAPYEEGSLYDEDEERIDMHKFEPPHSPEAEYFEEGAVVDEDAVAASSVGMLMIGG